MNIKKNNKGFTIVELVIVIAVVAILAAVLIPTFSNLVDSAQDSSAMQQAKNAYTNYLVEASDELASDVIIKIDDAHYYVVDDNNFVQAASGNVIAKFTTAADAIAQLPALASGSGWYEFEVDSVIFVEMTDAAATAAGVMALS
ncbi:MAG: type II secretion system protein [Eggerthellaceae bacterium]|nr:type II secretion system protein [Eggerthellaceae bacterium]